MKMLGVGESEFLICTPSKLSTLASFPLTFGSASDLPEEIVTEPQEKGNDVCVEM